MFLQVCLLPTHVHILPPDLRAGTMFYSCLLATGLACNKMQWFDGMHQLLLMIAVAWIAALIWVISLAWWEGVLDPLVMSAMVSGMKSTGTNDGVVQPWNMCLVSFVAKL